MCVQTTTGIWHFPLCTSEYVSGSLSTVSSGEGRSTTKFLGFQFSCQADFPSPVRTCLFLAKHSL